VTWRVARDGVRLFAIANAVYAVAGVTTAVLGMFDRGLTSTTRALSIPFAVVASACVLLQLVAAIAIARMPRETRGKGAATAWAVVWVVIYALVVGGPYLVAVAPDARLGLSIMVIIAWLAEAWLFLVVAVAVTRSAGPLFVLSLAAVLVRVATLAIAAFVDIAALRTLVPALAYALLIATKLAWARRLARAIPPREPDRIELDAKSREVARHTLALFRRAFTARLACVYAGILAIVVAASLRSAGVVSAVGVVVIVAMVVTSALLMIALGGWAVVGGRFGKLAGWLAALDFAVGLAWIAIAIFSIDVPDMFGFLARAATVVIGAAAPLAFALSLARVAATEPLAKDGRRVAWAIAGFALALAAALALTIAPIRSNSVLAAKLYATALSTLPGVIVGASALVAIYLLAAVRSAERALGSIDAGGRGATPRREP
jgi:hypothetical protein